MNGTNGSDIEGLTLPIDEDFDPNIQLDNLGPKTTPASTIDVKLWAQTVYFYFSLVFFILYFVKSFFYLIEVSIYSSSINLYTINI